MNEVGAAPRLRMHIIGEAMLNDGSSVVFYKLFREIFFLEQVPGLGREVNAGQGFAFFWRNLLGGFAFGIAFSMALIAILYKLERRFEREEIVLQVTATVTVAYII